MEHNFTEGKWFCLDLLWQEADNIEHDVYLSKDSALRLNVEENERIRLYVENPAKFFDMVVYDDSGMTSALIQRKVVLSNNVFSLDGTAFCLNNRGLIKVTYDLHTAKSLQPGCEAPKFPSHFTDKKLQGPFLQMLYYVNGDPCLYQFDPMLKFYTDEMQRQNHALNMLRIFLWPIQLPAVEDVDMAPAFEDDAL